VPLSNSNKLAIGLCSLVAVIAVVVAAYVSDDENPQQASGVGTTSANQSSRSVWNAPLKVKADSRITDELATARHISTTEPKRAREILRRVLEVEPNNEEALQELATRMFSDENIRAAQDLAQRCQRVNPRNQTCGAVLVLAPLPSPQLEKKSFHNEQCVQKRPDFIHCIYGRAWMLMLQGRLAEAEDFFRRTLALNPESPFALLARGRLKALAGAYSEARELFERACERSEASKHEACFRLDVLRREGW
jgi:tetratricopeptide (TPR) repeat protein